MTRAVAAAESGADRTVLNFPSSGKRRVRKTRLWLLSGLLILTVMALMWFLVFSPALALRHLRIDGQKYTSIAQIQEKLMPLQGKPLPQITQAEVEGLLAALPSVKEVSLEANPPSTLLVHIQERIPVAVMHRDETFTLVDPQGTALGIVEDPKQEHLPIIEGASIGNPETFEAITGVLAVLPEDLLARMASASAASPDSVELTLTDGKKIIWGDESERTLKARVVEAFLRSPAQGSGSSTVVYDVSAPQRPVTRSVLP